MDNKSRCEQCNGEGAVLGDISVEMVIVCPTCNGTGKSEKEKQ